MKKFAPLFLLLGLGLFTVGCEKKAADTAPAEPAATDAPAEPATETPAE